MSYYDVEFEMRLDDYRFEAWFDAGNECGLNQRDVYVCARTPIERVPLHSVSGRHLLRAYQGADRAARERAFAATVAQLEAEFAPAVQALAQAAAAAQPRSKKDKRAQTKQRQALERAQQRSMQRLERALARELAAFPHEQFDLARLAPYVIRWDQARFLRSFYFEEANEPYIRNFCRKYAVDPTYRAEVDAGTTPWAKRNALFYRNLRVAPPHERAQERLWKWICLHAADILALPEYARLQQLDAAFLPSLHEYDPEIRAAVAAWNAVPGVATRWSCQGVSGLVTYDDHELLAVSPHDLRAYIDFAAVSAPAADAVYTLAPDFPTIQVVGSPDIVDTGDDWQLERHLCRVQRIESSGGNANLAFRHECVQLAEEVRRRLGT